MHRALVCIVALCFVGLLCVHDLKWLVDHRSLEQRAELTSGGDFWLDPTIDEIFQSWKQSCINLESYAFDINIEEYDHIFGERKHSQAQFKTLMQQDGSCWIRIDELEKPDRPTSSTLIVGNKCYLLSYRDKSIVGLDLSRRMMKTDLANKEYAVVPLLPLFRTSEVDLHQRFEISLIQKDKDYTWIRFLPLNNDDQRYMTVAQIGVINYHNTKSPKHFPLCIMWREPGGKEITWNFTKVQINNSLAVTSKDFQLNMAQLRKEKWKDRQSTNFAGQWIMKILFNEPIDWTVLQKK
ncbi:MAG: hypothetical protein QM703_11455 [Gemmatales bacterium]